MIRHFALTDTGKRREHNEDAMLADGEHGLFVIADGVGGRTAGEVASAITIETFTAAADELAEVVKTYTTHPEWTSRNDVLQALDDVCQRATRAVFDHAEARGRRGMTTTVVAVLVGGGGAFLAHVGDSRAYLIREGLMRQLTEDHSMVSELVRTGQMSLDEARRSRYRSVITRAIGLYPTVQADLMSIDVLPGDRLVLASDGLSDPVPADLIQALACEEDVETATGQLVQAALDRGGPDNVTVCVIEPEATPQTEEARARAAVLQSLFLFKDLPFHARLRVSRICEETFFTPGQELVREHDPGDSMWAIVQGRVGITRDGVELTTLGVGEHFGELGLLDSVDRSATVVGADYGSALVIRRAHLREFCQRDPVLGNQLLWRLVETLGTRLHQANQLAAQSIRDSK